MKKKIAWAGAFLAATFLSGGVRAAGPVTLAVQGRANANVSLASSGRFVAAVWSATTAAGEGDIEAAVSRDAGGTFGTPVRVNKTPGSARAGGEQPPRVSLARSGIGDPALVIAWTENGIAGTRLVTARSNDGGRTFGAGTIVPGSDAPGNRGWESIAADPSGHVDAIWLDHRDAAAGGMDMSHHMEHTASAATETDAVAKAQLSKLFFATLGGGSPGRALAAGVCYCCKTALTVGLDGTIYAAWRHVYAGNIRDIAFTMSKDAGKSFTPAVRVSEDKWALDGCPENGPAIAVDTKRAIHLAWPTLIPGPGGGNLGLFYATSADGRSFTAREAVPTTGTPRHVQIAIAEDSAVVLVWDEGDANGHRVAMGRRAAAGKDARRFVRQAVTTLGTASYPALTVVPGGILIAATTGNDTDSVVRVVRVGER